MKKQQERYVFPAVFNYDDTEISVVFPDLGVATCGTDETDAFASARDLLGTVICGLEEDKESIPVPSKLRDIAVNENEIAVLIDVFMPSFRMADKNKAVSRTVTLPAWMNAAAIEKGVNFSQMLQKAILEHIGDTRHV